jgi:siroheme synthase-like protein
MSILPHLQANNPVIETAMPDKTLTDYPVMLKLAGQCCLLVGGGQAAYQKLIALLQTGVQIVVVSPDAISDIQQFAQQGRIEWQKIPYAASVLDTYSPMLVFAATNDAAVNQQVRSDAVQRRILVNTLDDGASGSFNSMAVVRRGPLTIALHSGGHAPALTRHLKTVIEQTIGTEYGVLAQWLGEIRPAVKTALPTPAQRQRFYETILASNLLSLIAQHEPTAYQQFQAITQEWGI